MDTRLTTAALSELLAFDSPPCLSIFQPTHRTHPENRQDPIRFRHLVKELETSLKQAYPAANIDALLAPFQALAQDETFWKHTLDGLAVMGGEGVFRTFLLARTVDEMAVVAESFHTLPLRRALQSDDRYHVLGLSLQKFRLFEGGRDHLHEIELGADLPVTIGDALGHELTEPERTVSSHGGLGSGTSPMQHGHGGNGDEADTDSERYFRAVDRALIEHYSKPSGLPLILAALPEHHNLFRKVSHNRLLLDAGIELNPDALDLDALGKRAWQVFEPQYRARQDAWVGAFEKARARGLGSDDLKQVAEAAATGRVGTLLVEAERRIPGRLDSSSGAISPADPEDPKIDCLLDDIGELVAKMGGDVHVLVAERMPGNSGLAATYRH